MAIATTAPVVTPSGTTNTFTWRAAVAIDTGVTVSSPNNVITGATVTISGATFKTGDTLNYTAVSPISIVSNTGGVLTLTGSAPRRNTRQRCD